MPKLTIVVGLPGAGKTTFIGSRKELSEAFRRRFGRVDAEVIAALKKDRDCVSDDTQFCHPNYRREFKKWIRDQIPKVELKWVFFDKDVSACLNNLVHDVAYKDSTIESSRSRARSFFDCVKVYELPPPEEYPTKLIRKVGKAKVPKKLGLLNRFMSKKKFLGTQDMERYE